MMKRNEAIAIKEGAEPFLPNTRQQIVKHFATSI